MAQRCRVCCHPERARIELALARKLSLEAVARRFGLHRDSVARHRKNHLLLQVAAALAAAGKPSDIDLDALRKTESEGLLQHLVAQRGRLHHLSALALDIGDVRAASGVEGRIVENLQLTAKLLGEITAHHKTTVNNLIVAPEYITARSALIRALQPYPEARRAVAKVLATLEGAEPHFTGVRGPPPLLEGTAHAQP